MNKRRVLFLCIGNACRSQMAEAFARAYGSDVLEIASAGLSPAYAIPAETQQVMEEKGLSLDGQFPKSLDELEPRNYEFIANLSGAELSGLDPGVVLDWPVRDPYGPDLDLHRAARDRIEALVQQLILDLRQGRSPLPNRPPEQRRGAFLSRLLRWRSKI